MFTFGFLCIFSLWRRSIKVLGQNGRATWKLRGKYISSVFGSEGSFMNDMTFFQIVKFEVLDWI